MDIKKGMILDGEYGKLHVVEELPNNVFKCSYDPDFAENDQFMTIDDLKNFKIINK